MIIASMTDQYFHRQHYRRASSPSEWHLFIRNLPYHATEEDVIGFFGYYGFEVIAAKVQTIERTKDNRTYEAPALYGTVQLRRPSDIFRAVQFMNGASFNGRFIELEPFRSDRSLLPPSERQNREYQLHVSFMSLLPPSVSSSDG